MVPGKNNARFSALLQKRKFDKSQTAADLEQELKSYTAEERTSFGILRNTLLHQAALEGDLDLCQALINTGAAKAARNLCGQTPYDLVKNGQGTNGALTRLLNY